MASTGAGTKAPVVVYRSDSHRLVGFTFGSGVALVGGAVDVGVGEGAGGSADVGAGEDAVGGVAERVDVGVGEGAG